MNLIEPFEHQGMVAQKDALTSLTLSFFIGSCTAAWYIYYLYNKVQSNDTKLGKIDTDVYVLQEEQSVQRTTLEDHDHRIREKKDYDECEEVEEKTYQAWNGSFKGSAFSLNILIWREKYSTMKKNIEWKNWNGEKDGASVVRDFYLGNSNPDFPWTIQDNLGIVFKANVSETVINGWDSVVRIEIKVTAHKDNVLEYIQAKTFDKDASMNQLLKNVIDNDEIQWSRILITV